VHRPRVLKSDLRSGTWIRHPGAPHKSEALPGKTKRCQLFVLMAVAHLSDQQGDRMDENSGRCFSVLIALLGSLGSVASG
jgi:hypothetical protein